VLQFAPFPSITHYVQQTHFFSPRRILGCRNLNVSARPSRSIGSRRSDRMWTRLSGSSANGSIIRRRTEGSGRAAESWPTANTEHTEEFLTGGNGEGGGLRVGRKEAQEAQNKTESQLSLGLGSSRVKLDQAAEA